MQCNDCPNHTDSKCCHDSIKPITTNFDEDAFVREMQHKEMMQQQTKKEAKQ